MKNLLSFAFLSLFVVTANACPDLAGDYINCTSGDEETDIFMEIEPSLVMTQSIVNGAMTYTSDDGVEVDSITIGKLESETELEDGITYTTESLASCQGDKLNLNQKIIISGDGANMEMGFNMAMTANSAGIEMSTEVITVDSDSEFITVNCDRK
jgi:hypothetical protein